MSNNKIRRKKFSSGMKMSFQTCGLARDSSSSKIQEEDFRQATIPDFPQEASAKAAK